MGFISSLFGKSKKDTNPKVNITYPPGDAAAKTSQKALSAPPPWEVNRLLLNEYRVEGRLGEGEGAIGAVYRVVRSSDGARFAVKTLPSSVLADERKSQLFMRELRTWMGLAEHPHIAVCRFFRSIDERLAIFADYVEGGSLRAWIKAKDLLGIEQVLDVAIQSAWGLEAAHVQGVVHQDMKPANVLMTNEGIARITDFGLARARYYDGLDQFTSDRPQSIEFTVAGMTPAYCSPEQAAGQKLSFGTDIWSWGLTVLEMFTGGVAWAHGKFARQALEEFAKHGSNPPFPKMPGRVAGVLQRCFEQDPSRRWASLGEAAEELRRIYREVSGQDYPRKKPELKSRAAAVGLAHDRRTTTGATWADPRELLAIALRHSGRGASELEDILKEQKGSRKNQALLDLELYERAARIYTDLVKQGRKGIEAGLAHFYQHKAFLHENLADGPGAILMYDQGIAIYERLVVSEGRIELSDELAMAYMNKANALWSLGEARAAVGMYDQGIAIYERLVASDGRTELSNSLARTYLNKANALYNLGEVRAAVSMFDQAIAIYERLVASEGRTELSNELAKAYMHKAAALVVLGEARAAVSMFDQVLAIYERLVFAEGRTELSNDLAMAYMNKANALKDLGESQAAVGMYDQAISIYERLVMSEGRTELSNDLARIYMNKANALQELGDAQAAVDLYDQAIEIRERLVVSEGRTELSNNLAMTFMNKANALQELGDAQAAVGLYDQAISIYERLVMSKGRTELSNDLAMAYVNKVRALYNLGEARVAVSMCDRAIAIYKRLVIAEGRTELLGELCWTKLIKAASLNDLGETRKAKNEAQAAVSGLRKEIKRTDRADLKNVLNWAETNLKMLLE